MEITLLVVGILLIGIYLYYENTTLKLTKYDIENTKIPNGFNKYKIVHISDFHNTKSDRLTNAIVNRIKKEAPDIIVITGDTIDSRRTRIDIGVSFLKRLVKIANVYYVPGNHESRIEEYEAFKKALISIGVNVLENKVELLTKNSENINLLGIKDPAFSHKIELADDIIVKKQIEDIKYNKELYTILLSHRPELFGTYQNENIDLVFTGHAHGGQIRLPFIGGIIAPAQGLFPKLTEGIHNKKNTTMIISRGIGNSLFPFRINNRPELLIVELKNK